MTKISIVTPTYNEEQNIKLLCEDVKKEFEKIDLEYEHIIIDNASTDNTIKILEEICSKDKKVKVIVNSKNYGHIRSPFYGLLQTNSDATILMASDFQDPIDLIPKYIEEWKKGKKIVLGQKTSSEENKIKYSLRNMFYNFLNKISDSELTNNTTGAGIFDKTIVEKLKKINDPYPYFRGLISELGEDITTIEFKQPKRNSGETKNNILTLYDIGMLGIVKHSRIPLRFMTFLGFTASVISLLIGLIYLFYKLLFWDSFSLGIAPVVIGIFIVSSIQIILLGLIGEYIGIILLHQRNMPLVIEKQRINFD
jgi:glycosyltransferase involved in cell wall biosynthesis